MAEVFKENHSSSALIVNDDFDGGYLGLIIVDGNVSAHHRLNKKLLEALIVHLKKVLDEKIQV